MSYQPKKERNGKANRGLKVLLAVLSVVLVALLVLIPVLYHQNQLRNERRNQNIRSSVTIEVGSAIPGAEAFLVEAGEEPAIYVGGTDGVDTAVPGGYPIALSYYEKTYTATIFVVDTEAPAGTPVDHTVKGGEALEAGQFVADISDATPVTVAFKTEPDFWLDGEQDVTVVLTDTSGNTTEVTAKLTVIVDSTPPEIQGVEDFLIYVGDAVSYRSGVTVTDDMDEAPTLSVDSSNVDLSTPGVYEVIYNAADNAGNTASVTATITVLEKKEGYASLEEINAMADKIIAQIITDDMTDREKVETIFLWAKRSFSYVGYSDKSDWHQGAYTMLKKRQGDCFNYFSVTKLLFERLGIPNIDVVKVKNFEGDSNHFWSLVSVDGGETYYHFDCCPRRGEGDWFLLVTDAQLDAYSDSHNHSHNRDKSLYPATPEA